MFQKLYLVHVLYRSIKAMVSDVLFEEDSSSSISHLILCLRTVCIESLVAMLIYEGRVGFGQPQAIHWLPLITQAGYMLLVIIPETTPGGPAHKSDIFSKDLTFLLQYLGCTIRRIRLQQKLLPYHLPLLTPCLY